MLSTLKNAKSIWSINPGGSFYTSVVVPLVILVALFKRRIGQGSSKSGVFMVDLPWVLFLPCFLSGNRYMTKLLRNKLREIFFWKCTDIWDHNIPISMRVYLDKFWFEYILGCFESGRLISRNVLEGQQSHNVQQVHT